MKPLVLALVFVSVIFVSTVFSADFYFITLPNNGPQTYSALAGYSGYYWGASADKVFLAGARKDLDWLDQFNIAYDAIPFDDETSTLYLCYINDMNDVTSAAVFTGQGYVVSTRPAENAKFYRRLSLRAMPRSNDYVPQDIIQTYNSRIDSLLAHVSQDTIMSYLRKLSGAAPIVINGGLDTVHTRYSGTADNRLASQYLKETLEQYGCQAEYHAFYSGNSRHVSSYGPDHAWLVTEASDALRTTDGGVTWVTMPDNTVNSLWGVANWGPDSVWISGNIGTVKFSSNGGASFSSLTVPTTAFLFGIDFISSTVGWIAADSGKVIHTTDAGLSWSRQSTPVTSRFYDICFADSANGWAVGRDGVIVHTTNGGANWIRQTSTSIQRLYGVDFTSPANGWVAGWGGTLLHTVNGGSAWETVNLWTDVNMYHVAFTDSLHGCVDGWGGAIYRTSDGGVNWTQIQTGLVRDFYGLTFADSLIGYAVGDGIVVRTTDGGLTWENQNAGIETAWRNVIGTLPGTTEPNQQVIICGHYDNTSEMPSSRAPGSDDNGSGSIAVIEAARVLTAMDYHKTIKFCFWTGEEQGLLGSAAYAADAAARGDDIVGVFNFDMIAWDGNGDNSVELHCGTMPSSLDLGNLFNEVVTDYGITLTPDILTWNSTDRSDHASFWDNNYPAMLGIEDFSSDFNPYYHTTSDNMQHIDSTLFYNFARAGAGAVATLATVDTTSQAVWDDGQVPESFMMLRSYPNPFNPAATISFNLPANSNVNLTIYDLLGRKVTTLINGPMQAGSHFITWNASDRASGIYLCRLRVGENVTAIRMMLIK